MCRTEIINRCFFKYKFEKYLEIGVGDGFSIERISAKYKDGVDPGVDPSYSHRCGLVNHKMTSDEFFRKIENSKILYDFIFIDGLHHTEQVDKDIFNSLKHLSPNGFIMLHDVSPSSFKTQIVPRAQVEWTGDVWKSVVKLRCLNPNIEIVTIDTDFGCCILRSGRQKLYDKDPLEIALDWNYFVRNRIELLNLIPVEEFIKRML